MIRKNLAGAIFLLLLAGILSAQPKLRIVPEVITFPDTFNRLQNVLLINQGNQPVTIDSIYYRRNLYYMRFNNSFKYRQVLYPSDTLKMDCILSNYFLVTQADTLDTMYVYSASSRDAQFIRIKTKFFYSPTYSSVSGTVTDGQNPLYGSKIYFYYSGKYLFDSAYTDNKGFYKKILPEGKYIAAAQKEGYYLTYFPQQSDPSQAEAFYIKPGIAPAKDFVLNAKPSGGFGIKGSIFDKTGQSRLSKTIVVIRGGSHTPDGRNIAKASFAGENIYSTISDEYGSYEISGILSPGYYHIQAFTDFYLPGYYNAANNVSVLWQTSDSVYLNTDLSGKDVYVARDSSFGAGIIGGTVSFAGQPAPVYEGIIVLAKSASGNSYITYSFVLADGSFTLTDLPYGSYQIVAQKTGYNDAVSKPVVINSSETGVRGVSLVFSSFSTAAPVPSEVLLYPNYPNPFNPATNIQFFLPENGTVRVDVTNSLGQRVTELFNGEAQKGLHRFTFDGNPYSAGAYFVRLITSHGILTRKIMLIK